MVRLRAFLKNSDMSLLTVTDNGLHPRYIIPRHPTPAPGALIPSCERRVQREAFPPHLGEALPQLQVKHRIHMVFTPKTMGLSCSLCFVFSVDLPLTNSGFQLSLHPSEEQCAHVPLASHHVSCLLGTAEEVSQMQMPNDFRVVHKNWEGLSREQALHLQAQALLQCISSLLCGRPGENWTVDSS